MNYTHALNRKNIFFILISLVGLFLLAYAYFISQTVSHIVARQNMTKQMSQMSSDVAVLESSYMTLSSALTMDHAYALGFNDVKSGDTTFVERPLKTVAIR